MDDISIVIKIVLSTASKERVRIFELLIANKGTLRTSHIVDSLNITAPTAKRTMAEFKAIGLVNIDTIPSEHGEDEYQITLLEEFDWFLSERFAELNYEYRNKFSPHLYEKKLYKIV